MARMNDRGNEARWQGILPRSRSENVSGSWMPLDTQLHWDRHNPLNLIPAAIAALLVYALVHLLV